MDQTELTPAPPRRETHWKSLFRFLPVPIALWLLQFALQYWWLSRGDMGSSLFRSFALAGATLISTALLSSIVFKFVPRWAKYWRIRRYLGVSGFILILLHVLSVYHFVFDYNLFAAYYTLNPIANPIVFGSIAFVILFLMAATSTDWAMQKLTPKRWKFLHRFVYVAEISFLFHFLFVAALTPPVYVLLAILGLVMLGQIYWWVRIASKRGFRTVGTVVGLVLLVMFVVLGILEYRFWMA